ncbi:hypothetical protein Tco_1572899 [Tanacetum coccineum]
MSGGGDNAQIEYDLGAKIQENKKKRDEHAEIISSTKNPVSGSNAEASQRRKKSNYSSFQDLRSSCNEDMVEYEGPQPSTTRARTLNEKSNKKIPPATSQPPGWRVCRPAEGVPPVRKPCRPGLGAHVFHFTLEET